MKQKVMIFAIVIILTACSSSLSVSPTEISSVPSSSTSTFTPLQTPKSVVVPLTPTLTEVSGPKEGDKTVVTENGHTYQYTYTKIGETPDGKAVLRNKRDIVKYSLIDNPGNNFITFQISSVDSATGERSIAQLSHRDFTEADLPQGSYNPNPMTGAFVFELEERCFVNDSRNLSNNDRHTALQYEMLGEGEVGHEQAYLPIILSNGEQVKFKLSRDNGINMTIMDKETLLQLGGENVSKWKYFDIQIGNEFTFYSEVYGLDTNGNLLVRWAFDGSLADPKLTDEILRIALLSVPANFAQNQDQRQQGITDFAVTLGHLSDDKQNNNDTLELELERILFE